MACEVNNKEINSQCAELLVRPTYILKNILIKTVLHVYMTSQRSISFLTYNGF